VALASPLTAFGFALAGGLVGSAHCVGMCGAFAGSAGVRLRLGRRAEAAGASAAYHLGRLITYLALAMAAGLFGEALVRAAGWLRVQQVLTALMAGSLVVVGLGYLFGASSLLGRVPWLRRATAGLMRLGRQGDGWRGALLMGMGSTLLPCGFLYGFALAAAATGSLVGAGATMLGFWLGTTPALLGTALASGALRSLWSRRVPTIAPHRAVGALLIICGLVGGWIRMPDADAPATECHGVTAQPDAGRASLRP
jgi:sulfite exporter TauE/SafE